MQARDIQVGDAVFVKPANATCTTKWRQAVVSGFRKPHQVEIDGVPFHVSHIRRVPESGSTMPAEGLSSSRAVPRSTNAGDCSDSSDQEDEQTLNSVTDAVKNCQTQSNEVGRPRLNRAKYLQIISAQE